MDQLSALRLFRKTVELGSFAETARATGLTAAAVGKSISELEAHLKVRLFNRTTRRMSLTEAGTLYFQQVTPVLDQLEEADRSLTSHHNQPSGLLRVTAPLTMTIISLSRFIPEFLERYPEITLDLNLDDRLIDIVREGYDIAIKGSDSLKNSSLISRRVSTLHHVLCAAPSYFETYGTPQVPADLRQHMGGETTRALARSVANQSPEARAVIERTTSDRFAGQSQRAAEFIKKVVGGNADDISYRRLLQEQARYHNKSAYEAAYNAPHAQQVYTKGLQELMQSPSLRKAVAAVPTRSADRGAVQGFKEIGNPFTQNSQGAYVLTQKADGTLVAPNLQFWDHVKRNLDSQIGTAQRGGDASLMSDLNAIKNKLTSELDRAVPAYKQARQGAAGFFDAEDALDAGRKFVNSPRSVQEARQAFNAFNGTEKQAFATGYASELIDKIKATGDRANVINQVFKSQAARESMEMVLGAQKIKQIEAYVRVEDLADRLRGAMGNSTTARQLLELGIGAGAGAYTTGDWKGAVGCAMAVKGGKYLMQSSNDKVMQFMAKLLMSDQPQALTGAAQQAALKPAYMQALERLSDMLAIPARGGAVMAGQ